MAPVPSSLPQWRPPPPAPSKCCTSPHPHPAASAPPHPGPAAGRCGGAPRRLARPRQLTPPGEAPGAPRCEAASGVRRRVSHWVSLQRCGEPPAYVPALGTLHVGHHRVGSAAAALRHRHSFPPALSNPAQHQGWACRQAPPAGAAPAQHWAHVAHCPPQRQTPHAWSPPANRPRCGVPPGRHAVGCVRPGTWAGGPSVSAQRGQQRSHPCQGSNPLLLRHPALLDAWWPCPPGGLSHPGGGVSPRRPGGAQIRRTRCRNGASRCKRPRTRRSPRPRSRVACRRPAWLQAPQQRRPAAAWRQRERCLGPPLQEAGLPSKTSPPSRSPFTHIQGACQSRSWR